MVGICSALIVLGLWLGWSWWRRRDIPRSKWFLRATAVSGIAAIVALECGWIVTEVGRQPWVVYNIMRTKDAVTGASGVWVTFSAVLLLYTGLAVATVFILRTMAHRWRAEGIGEADVPYGPSKPPSATTPSAGSSA
jgi:cytochrome d ubiquinol oxidase subunit I